MYHSCFWSSLYTSAFNALWKTNESRYAVEITMVEFPDDVHLILCKSRFDACLECQATMLSKLSFKKRVCKKYWFLEKKIWIQTHDLLNPSQLFYPMSYMYCGCQWNVAQAFSTSSSSTRCRAQADHCINSRWQTWCRRMISLWC